MMRSAGFEYADVGLFYHHDNDVWKLSDDELKEKMQAHAQELLQHGIQPWQTHAPMDAYNFSRPEDRYLHWDCYLQAIKATAFMGAKYIVVHPITTGNRKMRPLADKEDGLNWEFYSYLKPTLIRYGVKCAVENVYPAGSFCSTAEKMVRFFEKINADCPYDVFGACLDVGHAANYYQNPATMIRILGKRYLFATHIHDNNYVSDLHLFPGAGSLDWYSIGKALRDIGFEECFNYETSPYYDIVDCDNAKGITRAVAFAMGAFARAIRDNPYDRLKP